MLGIRAAAYAGIVLWGMRKILRKVSVARTPTTTIYDYINSNEFREAYSRNLQLYKDNIERIKREQNDWYPIAGEERNGNVEKYTGYQQLTSNLPKLIQFYLNL